MTRRSDRGQLSAAAAAQGVPGASEWRMRTLRRTSSPPAVMAPAGDGQPLPGYWPRAHVACALIFLVVAARATELLPFVSVFRPVFTTTVVCSTMLWRRTSLSIRSLAFADRRMKLVYAYGVWIFIAMLFGVSQGSGFVIVKQLPWQLATALAFGFCQAGTFELKRMLGWITGAIVVAGVVGTVFGVQEGGRLGTGGSLDPNDFAALMALGIPLALGCLTRASGKMKIGFVLATLLMAAVIARTGSRGGLLALVASALVYAAGFKVQRAIVTGGVLVMLGVGLWFEGPPVFRERAQSIFAPEDDYNTTAEVGRVELWKRATGYIVQHPVFGVGPNCFALADGMARMEVGRRGAWLTVHDLYLQAFAELGLPGGMLLLVLLGSTLRVGARCWRRSATIGADQHFPEIMAMLVAFVVAAIFLSQAYSYVLFGIIGLINFTERSVSAPESATDPGGRIVR